MDEFRTQMSNVFRELRGIYGTFDKIEDNMTDPKRILECSSADISAGVTSEMNTIKNSIDNITDTWDSKVEDVIRAVHNIN